MQLYVRWIVSVCCFSSPVVNIKVRGRLLFSLFFGCSQFGFRL